MTKFEKWVKKFGVNRLVGALREAGPDAAATPSAVYQWLYGETEPRSVKVTAMVRISRGAINLDDVYRHIQIARRHRAERAQRAEAAASVPVAVAPAQ